MSWQAFSWQEIFEQARVSQLTERLQPAIDWTGTASNEALKVVSAFLTPLALILGTLGVWRLGSDLGFTGDFFIEDGILSHWQVWLALAIGVQLGSVSLNRRLKNQIAARPYQG